MKEIFSDQHTFWVVAVACHRRIHCWMMNSTAGSVHGLMVDWTAFLAEIRSEAESLVPGQGGRAAVGVSVRSILSDVPKRYDESFEFE